MNFTSWLSASLCVLEGLFAEVRYAPVDVQIDALKIMEFRGEIEDTLRERRVDLKSYRVGLFVELANIVGGGAILGHLDLHVFRVAGFEDLAINNGWAVGRAAGEGERGGCGKKD